MFENLFKKRILKEDTSVSIEENAVSNNDVVAAWKVGSGWHLTVNNIDWTEVIPDIVRRIRCIGTFGTYTMFYGYSSNGCDENKVAKDMGLSENDWINVNDSWLCKITDKEDLKVQIYQQFQKADGNRCVDFNHDWTYDDDFLVDWGICKDIPDRASTICHRIDSGWDYACKFYADQIRNQLRDDRAKYFIEYAERHGISAENFVNVLPKAPLSDDDARVLRCDEWIKDNDFWLSNECRNYNEKIRKYLLATSGIEFVSDTYKDKSSQYQNKKKSERKTSAKKQERTSSYSLADGETFVKGVKCPFCKGKIVSRSNSFDCEYGDFRFNKHSGVVREDDLRDVIKFGHTTREICGINKDGVPFCAKDIKISKKNKGGLVYYWEKRARKSDN